MRTELMTERVIEKMPDEGQKHFSMQMFLLLPLDVTEVYNNYRQSRH